MPKKKTGREADNGSMLIKRIAVCSVIGVIVFFLIIIAFSFAELKMSFRMGSYLPVGIVAAFVSSLISGFISVFKTKKNVFLSGAVTGALIGFISDIIIFIINGGSVGTGLLYVFLASVAGGIAGAVVAANIRLKKKY